MSDVLREALEFIYTRLEHMEMPYANECSERARAALAAPVEASVDLVQRLDAAMQLAITGQQIPAEWPALLAEVGALREALARLSEAIDLYAQDPGWLKSARAQARAALAARPVEAVPPPGAGSRGPGSRAMSLCVGGYHRWDAQKMLAKGGVEDGDLCDCGAVQFGRVEGPSESGRGNEQACSLKAGLARKDASRSPSLPAARVDPREALDGIASFEELCQSMAERGLFVRNDFGSASQVAIRELWQFIVAALAARPAGREEWCSRYIAGEGRHRVQARCPLAPAVACSPEEEARSDGA